MPGDRAEDDLLVRAEHLFQALLSPGDGGGGVAVDDAPQGGVVLLEFDVNKDVFVFAAYGGP